MQLGIVGKGSIGKCLAYSLLKSTSHNPSLLVRPNTFKSLINKEMITSNKCNVNYYPLELDSNKKPNVESSEVSVYPMKSCADKPSFDVIVICTKSFQLIEAMNQLESNNFLDNNPTLILFHNGIISTSDIPSFIKQRDIPLLFGTTVHAATTFDIDGPFDVRHTGTGLTWLGFRQPFMKNVHDTDILCKIFDVAFNPCTWYNDLEPHLLWKLAINSCINPLTAIYQIRNDGLIGNEKYQDEMRQICTELCDVFRAYYNDLTENGMNTKMDRNSVETWNKLCYFQYLWDIVSKALEKVKLNYSSMNRDIYYNRQTEIDQINGYVVQLGKKYGINVNFNEDIVQHIHELQTKYLMK